LFLVFYQKALQGFAELCLDITTQGVFQGLPQKLTEGIQGSRQCITLQEYEALSVAGDIGQWT
jgi:hypothetical protein